MKTSPFFALLLALPLAATAQTKTTTTPAPSTTTTTPAPAGTQQQTEVTEELDPATGKVIRRTTRTINVPVGTAPAPAGSTYPTTTPTPSSTAATMPATDAQVSAFLGRKTVVSTLSTTNLISAYDRFMDRVRSDRRSWRDADWARASNVLSALNSRYEQLRDSFGFNDKLNIRSQQAEYQTLRTARQLSDQVSDKL